MIYVWLKHLFVMHKYRSREEFWESLDYKYAVVEGVGGFKIMCESLTPYWKE